MKKVCGILLIAIIISGMLAVSAFAGNVAISAASATGKPGETVEIAIQLPENPGLTSLQIKITAAAPLELVSLSDAKTLGLESQSPSADKMTWAGSDASSGTGTIAVLAVKIAEDAVAGEYPVKIDVTNASALDEIGIPTDIDATGTTVNISVNAGTPPTDPPTTTEPPKITDPTTTTQPPKSADPTTTTQPPKSADPTTTTKPTTTEKPTESVTAAPSTKDNGGNKGGNGGTTTSIPRTGDAGISTVVAVAVIAFGAATVAIVSKKKNDE